MDWTQVLAIVLPVMFAIIIGVFYNNRRLDDVNRRIDDLRADFSDLKVEIREMRNMLVELLKKEAVM